MKTDIARQLDGYAEVVREIAVARKYGSDFTPLRGRFQDAIAAGAYDRALQLAVPLLHLHDAPGVKATLFRLWEEGHLNLAKLPRTERSTVTWHLAALYEEETKD